MLLFRPHWCAIFVLGLALCSVAYAKGQVSEVDVEEESAGSPFGSMTGSKFRDNRDRGLSESVRRFGREHQSAIILGIEPVLIQGRNLNRIKSLDEHGRVVIWIDDPQAPSTSVRRGADNDGDGW